jgi:hypothetical protein
MRKVYTAESLIDVSHLRNVLEAAGIQCIVRNDRLAGILGEIPFVECWPELWVVRPGDALHARGLIEIALGHAPAGEQWTCPDCGERLEPAFTECWRCVPGDTGEIGA